MVMPKPCRECPFRKKSTRGWLGGFTPQDTYGAALSESIFDCHLTRGTDDPHQCAGRLLFAHKACKRFRTKPLNEAMDLLVEINDLDKILDPFGEFMEHHDILGKGAANEE